MLNINRKLNDCFNRYRMPKLEAKVEGRGNGIKTVLVNMSEIAKALKRPATYPTKYLGCCLGAQTIMGEKGKYIVNGQHECVKLQSLLDGFIEKYVLCSKCDNPETLIIVKKEKIALSCMACGGLTPVRGQDRTFAYIIRNPPSDSNELVTKNYKPSATNSDSTDDNSLTSNSQNENGEISENGINHPEELYQIGVIEVDDEDEEFSKYFSSLPLELKEVEKENEVWSVDLSEDAVRRRRMEEISCGMSALTYTEELDLPMRERLELFRKFVNDRVTKEVVDAPEYQEIHKETIRMELDSRAIGIVCECLFTDHHMVIAMIKNHSNLFKLMVSKGRKVEKCLLGVIEALLKKYHNLILQINDIFNLLYDLELVSESTFIIWHELKTSDYSSNVFLMKLQKSANPFIEWLKNAEEEGEEEDNETEQYEMAETTKESNPDIDFQHSLSASESLDPSKVINQEDELELDIDAI